MNINNCYIFLEGVSGAGKDTQALLLREWFEKNDKKCLIVAEPSALYALVREYVAEFEGGDLDQDKSLFRKLIMIADRYKSIMNTVIPALENGISVISVRSFLSTIIYQCVSDEESAEMARIHSFVPKPSVAVVYDLSELDALGRIMARGSEQPIRHHDKLESLRKHLPRYRDLARASFLDFPIELVDASDSILKVHDSTLKIVQKYMSN